MKPGGKLTLWIVILFASGFEEHRVHVKSLFQNPWAETALTCAVSLVVTYCLLLLVGQREAMSEPPAMRPEATGKVYSSAIFGRFFVMM